MQQHKNTTILDLPQEIIYNIFEYLIPSEFYCSIPSSEEDDVFLEWFKGTLQTTYYGYIAPVKRLDLYTEFEQFQNYLLIHKDLFYKNLIECHCNRHFIDIWKKCLLAHDISFNMERSRNYNCSQETKNLLNKAKTGDFQSVCNLVGEVLNRFNGPRTLLQTFFNVNFKQDEISYPLYEQNYDILRDILRSDDSGKIERLRYILAKSPSCTKNPKYLISVLHQVSYQLISYSIYSNEIRKIKKKSNESKTLKELLSVLFSDCGTVPFTVTNIEYFRIIIATAKVIGSEDLFKQLMYKWVLNNPCYAVSQNIFIILFGNTAKNQDIRFEYCIIESYLVKNQIDELETVISKLERESPDLVVGGIEEIISIFFKRFELFQTNLEENLQKFMGLIRSCWGIFDAYCEKSFILILKSLVSSVCRKALSLKDEKPIIKSLDYFYFELFSKRFLGPNLCHMETIIEKSKILNQAIEHPVIFKYFMDNLGKKTYNKQLNTVCKDSSIFSSILDSTAHFMGNSDNITFSYKLRIESKVYDPYDLFEIRMKLVREYLQNDSLIRKALADKSTKLNTDIEKILHYCNSSFTSVTPLQKTINKMQDYFKKL